jgi:hypothetical protein
MDAGGEIGENGFGQGQADAYFRLRGAGFHLRLKYDRVGSN